MHLGGRTGRTSRSELRGSGYAEVELRARLSRRGLPSRRARAGEGSLQGRAEAASHRGGCPSGRGHVTGSGRRHLSSMMAPMSARWTRGIGNGLLSLPRTSPRGAETSQPAEPMLGRAPSRSRSQGGRGAPLPLRRGSPGGPGPSAFWGLRPRATATVPAPGPSAPAARPGALARARNPAGVPPWHGTARPRARNVPGARGPARGRGAPRGSRRSPVRDSEATSPSVLQVPRDGSIPVTRIGQANSGPPGRQDGSLMARGSRFPRVDYRLEPLPVRGRSAARRSRAGAWSGRSSRMARHCSAASSGWPRRSWTRERV